MKTVQAEGKALLADTSWSVSSSDELFGTLVFTEETAVRDYIELSGYFDWEDSSGLLGRETFVGELDENALSLEGPGLDAQGAEKHRAHLV